MICTSILTYLSATSATINSGERAGEQYYRAHFLDSTDKPVSFGASPELYAKLKDEFVFGDAVLADLDVVSGANGTYTRLSAVVKK